MKTILKLSSLVILLTGFAIAGICNTSVYDDAGFLGGKRYLVDQAVENLNSKGADAHMLAVSLGNYTTMDALVSSTVRTCPSWQSPNGGVKSTLVVLAVAPRERKMGIYAGMSFNSAFGADRLTRYRIQYMAPYFKDGSWAEGLTAAADQMALRLVAYTAESNTPTPTEANNPVDRKPINEASSTSLSWLWFGMLLSLGGVIWFYVSKKGKKKQSVESSQRAQRAALSAENRASQLVDELNKQVAYQKATDSGKPGYELAVTLVNQAIADFGTLANSASTDPTSNNLPASSYEYMSDLFIAVSNKLIQAKTYLRNPYSSPENSNPHEVPISSPSSIPTITIPSTYISPTQHTIIRETVVNNNSGDFVTGMLVGDALADRRVERERYDEPPPIRREPDPEPQPKEDFTESSGSSGFESDTKDEPDSSSDGFTADSSNTDF